MVTLSLLLTMLRLLGQAVKTSPFHGGNTGSIPVGVIFKNIILDEYFHICYNIIDLGTELQHCICTNIILLWRSSQAVRRGSATP